MYVVMVIELHKVMQSLGWSTSDWIGMV